MRRIVRTLSSRTAKVWLGIVVALIGLRIALPFIVKDYVNKTLDGLEGYSGSVADVDLSLWRGAYQIEGLRIVRTEGQVPAPFVSIDEVDLSVEWKALLDGSIVAEIDLLNPTLNFVSAPSKKQSQVEPASNWTEVVQDLVPFSINRFSVSGGEVHYRDFNSDPKVDIYVQKLNMVARNLTNSEDLGGSLVASFEGSALAMGSGGLKFEGKVDPYAEQPTFDVNAKLNDLALPQLNDYLRAYANLDVEKGTLSIDAELAASKGRFKGYVKPFVEDLDVLRWQREEESLPNKLWQGLADAVGELLEDQDKDRIASRVPFEGRLDNPEADVWSALGSLLKNAFIEALRRGLEGRISLSTAARGGQSAE